MEEKKKHLAIFEGRQIRRHWDDKSGKWYFSVVDVVQILTNQLNFQIARKYWNKLKERLKAEGNQTVTNCHQLKMLAEDGKMRLTDVADTEIVLRIIQSIPSPNAEPFKIWLAQVGKERIDEIRDPELAVNRAKAIYEKKGYPRDWIDKRLRGINVRNTLTDEWKSRGLKDGRDFAILTDEIYKGTFGFIAQEYKKHKSLSPENNLRDHMEDLELILTMLGEATTTRLTKERDSKTFHKMHKDAKEGGEVAGKTRKDIEKRIGKKIVSERNFLTNGNPKLL
jgi:hypothetical protein